jgi:hypothetical protein
MPYIRVFITIAPRLESINPTMHEEVFHKPNTKGLFWWLCGVMEKIWYSVGDVMEKDAGDRYKRFMEKQFKDNNLQ